MKAFFLLWGSRNSFCQKGEACLCVPVVAGKLAWQKGECQGERKKTQALDHHVWNWSSPESPSLSAEVGIAGPGGGVTSREGDNGGAGAHCGGEMLAACVAGPGGWHQLHPEPPSGPRRWWSRSCPSSFSAGLTTKAVALTLCRGGFAASLPLPELLPNP